MDNEDVNRYMPRIQSEAVRIKSRLPYEINIDDMVNSGIFALIGCLKIYSSESSQEFATNTTTGDI
jgi:DNA-directed RNA polymerase specialized sigma subunit